MFDFVPFWFAWRREFPFLRWGSTATKPDWSAEEFCLWVELKYVREKSDIPPITEAIAADITNYGDNERRVLHRNTTFR